VVPRFVDGPNGRLLVTSFLPPQSCQDQGAVLCLPPFGEELNKTRRMLALQGRALAQRGITFVLPDLFGTGDSEGEFVEASHERWHSDMQFIVAWLEAQKFQSVAILAVRYGSLLLDSCIETASIDAAKVALWNPVMSGKTLLTQFLRTKVAAAMSTGEKTSVRALREQIARDGEIEVAGYSLSADMLSSVDSASLATLDIEPPVELLWADTGTFTTELAPAKARELQAHWSEKGIDINYRRIKGPQFWLSPEISEVRELIDLTSQFFGTSGS